MGNAPLITVKTIAVKNGLTLSLLFLVLFIGILGICIILEDMFYINDPDGDWDIFILFIFYVLPFYMFTILTIVEFLVLPILLLLIVLLIVFIVLRLLLL